MNIVSLFSGCGGLDLGFSSAKLQNSSSSGFNIIWANEYNKTIHSTYELNHPSTYLDKRDIRTISLSEIPNCDGIIGGPPCQSWSIGGNKKGIEDSRGQLFWNYIKVIQDKQPKFFLAENVKGILSPKHKTDFNNILQQLEDCNYNVSFKLLNSANYNVPQDRERVIIIGYRKDLNITPEFPLPNQKKVTLREALANLDYSIPNQEGFNTMNYSPWYMSRNRHRGWDEQSFTILATSTAIVQHPDYPMIKVDKDKYIFEKCSRQLNVRECARIQTFPDDFIFVHKNVRDGYNMVGNAVPVNFAKHLADSIKEQITE